MEQDTDVVRVRSSFERPRGPPVLIALIAIFVIVAVVKPWSFIDGAGTGSSTPPSRPAPNASDLEDFAFAPSASPGPADINALTCFADDTDQLVLLERWPDNEVRSWIAIPSGDASGPLDPATPTTTIHSSHLIGIGVCPRRAPSGSMYGGAWIHDVQLITTSATGRAAVDLGAWDPITKITETPEWAVLYGPRPSLGPTGSPASPDGLGRGPARTSPPPPATWPIGTYALAFSFPLDPTEQIHWLRIEIRAGARGAG